jgi:hypothetical protein
MKHILYLLLLVIFSLQSLVYPVELRDGKTFDKGASLTKPSPSAPHKLKLLNDILGNWQVQVITARNDTLNHSVTGISQIRMMNRGHAYFERLYADNFIDNGEDLHTITFLAYNKVNKIWNLAIANGYTENISMFSGAGDDKNLTLFNSIRENGGIIVVHYRLQLKSRNSDEFSVTIEKSTDEKNTWTAVQVRKYQRQTDGVELFTIQDNYGSANTELPQEARQFDFLIGEWIAHHELQVPNGQWVKFPANATAVHVLNGDAIMEHNWYDVDPSLPEAATSIVRIYNRAMRRWECMYLTNRFNSILYFGGHREGDRIILSNFETNSAAPSIGYYIFHDMAKDQYLWRAESSKDRGKSFNTTWKIRTERKK